MSRPLKPQLLLTLILTMTLFMGMTSGLTCSDPNMDFMASDSSCRCKPGYFLNQTASAQGNACLQSFFLSSTNIYGMNLTLSSDSPSNNEGTMLVALWHKQILNKDENQNVNSSLVRQPGAFDLGQRGGLAYTKIESTDINDYFYESTGLAVDRWVYTGFAILKSGKTLYYHSIQDRAVSLQGLKLNTTTNTRAVETYTSPYFQLCSGACRFIKKVFFMTELRLEKLTQPTIDFLAFSHQYKGGGATIGSKIILNINFDEGNFTSLKNEASAYSFVDSSENYGLTWQPIDSDTPILCDTRFYTILANGTCQLDGNIMRSQNPSAIAIPLNQVKINDVTRSFTFTFWFNSKYAVTGRQTLFSFDQSNINVELDVVAGVSQVCWNSGYQTTLQLDVNQWHFLYWSGTYQDNVGWWFQTGAVNTELIMYDEVQFKDPFFINETTLYLYNNAQNSKGYSGSLTNLALYRGFYGPDDTTFLNSMYYNRPTNNPNLFFYSTLKPMFYNNTAYIIDEVNLAAFNAKANEFQIVQLPNNKLQCDFGYQNNGEACQKLSTDGCAYWGNMENGNNKCQSCIESNGFVYNEIDATCSCKEQTFLTENNFSCQKLHYSVQKGHGYRRTDRDSDGDSCQKTFLPSALSCDCPLGLQLNNKECMPLCGNGILTIDEWCEDKNTQDGDGCNQYCKIEFGYKCESYLTMNKCYPQNMIYLYQYSQNYTAINYTFKFIPSVMDLSVTSLFNLADQAQLGTASAQLVNKSLIIYITNSTYNASLTKLKPTLLPTAFNYSDYRYPTAFEGSLSSLISADPLDPITNYKPKIAFSQNTTTLSKCYPNMNVSFSYNSSLTAFPTVLITWKTVSASPKANLTAYLATLTNQTAGQFSLDHFTLGQTIQIEISVTNLLSQTTKQNFAVLTSTTETNMLPSIIPSTKTSLNAKQKQPLTLVAPLQIDSCLSTYYSLDNLTYVWSLDQGPISNLTKVTNQRSITLDFGTSQGLLNLTLTVTGSGYFSGNVTQKYQIQVQGTGVKSIITGEEFQSQTMGIKLQGNTSYGIENKNNTGLAYKWSCIQINMTQGCNLTITNPSNSLLSIPSSSIKSNTLYTLQLTVTSNEGSETSTKVVKVYKNDPLLVISNEKQYYYTGGIDQEIAFFGNLYSFGNVTFEFQEVSWYFLDNQVDILQFNKSMISQPDIKLNSTFMKPDIVYTIELRVMVNNQITTQQKSFELGPSIQKVNSTFTSNSTNNTIQINNFDSSCHYSLVTIENGIAFSIASNHQEPTIPLPPNSNNSSIIPQQYQLGCYDEFNILQSQQQATLPATLNITSLCSQEPVSLINYVSCYSATQGQSQGYDPAQMIVLAELQHNSTKFFEIRAKDPNSQFLYQPWIEMCSAANNIECYQYLSKYMLSSELLMDQPIQLNNTLSQRVTMNQLSNLNLNLTNNTSFSGITLFSQEPKGRNLAVSHATKEYIDVFMITNNDEHSLVISLTSSSSMDEVNRNVSLTYKLSLNGYEQLSKADIILQVITEVNAPWRSDSNDLCSVLNVNQTANLTHEVTTKCQVKPLGVKIVVTTSSFWILQHIPFLYEVLIVALITFMMIVITIRKLCCSCIQDKSNELDAKLNQLGKLFKMFELWPTIVLGSRIEDIYFQHIKYTQQNSKVIPSNDNEVNPDQFTSINKVQRFDNPRSNTEQVPSVFEQSNHTQILDNMMDYNPNLTQLSNNESQMNILDQSSIIQSITENNLISEYSQNAVEMPKSRKQKKQLTRTGQNEQESRLENIFTEGAHQSQESKKQPKKQIQEKKSLYQQSNRKKAKRRGVQKVQALNPVYAYKQTPKYKAFRLIVKLVQKFGDPKKCWTLFIFSQFNSFQNYLKLFATQVRTHKQTLKVLLEAWSYALKWSYTFYIYLWWFKSSSQNFTGLEPIQAVALICGIVSCLTIVLKVGLSYVLTCLKPKASKYEEMPSLESYDKYCSDVSFKNSPRINRYFIVKFQKMMYKFEIKYRSQDLLIRRYIILLVLVGFTLNVLRVSLQMLLTDKFYSTIDFIQPTWVFAIGQLICEAVVAPIVKAVIFQVCSWIIRFYLYKKKFWFVKLVLRCAKSGFK